VTPYREARSDLLTRCLDLTNEIENVSVKSRELPYLMWRQRELERELEKLLKQAGKTVEKKRLRNDEFARYRLKSACHEWGMLLGIGAVLSVLLGAIGFTLIGIRDHGANVVLLQGVRASVKQSIEGQRNAVHSALVANTRDCVSDYQRVPSEPLEDAYYCGP